MKVPTSKLVIFILITGIVLTLAEVFLPWLLPYKWLDNRLIYLAILYSVFFLVYCIALVLYKKFISRVLWFERGAALLAISGLVKIFLAVTTIYIILKVKETWYFKYEGTYLELYGPFVRAFIVEGAFMLLAAKFFETDIFSEDTKRDEIGDELIDN